MLTLKAPIELVCNSSMIPAQEAFYHRITGNYAVMNARVDKEELLHMVTAPPEIYLGEGSSSILTNNVEIRNQQETRIEMVNNLLNRIVLTEAADLTYQDRVYITNVLNKLGIQDVSQFMKQVRILKDETQSTEHLISLYWNHMEELKSLVEEYQSSRVDVKQYTEAGEGQRGLYLHEEIMNRLKTGALYQILSSFYENHNGRGQYVTNQELKLTEQKRIASNILLNRLEAVAGGRRVPFVYRHENYYEEIHSEERDVSDHSVNSQITSAVLLNLIDNLYLNQFEKRVNQSAMWLHMEEALYQNAENTLVRLRSEAAGEGIHPYFKEEYSASSYQTLHRHMDAVLRLLSVNQELASYTLAGDFPSEAGGELPEERQRQEGDQILELSYRNENNWQENLYQNIIEEYFESLDQIPQRRDRQSETPSKDIQRQAELREEKELQEHPRQGGESQQPQDMYSEAVRVELQRMDKRQREGQRPLELHFSGGERIEETIDKTEERAAGFQEAPGGETLEKPGFAELPGSTLLYQEESYQQKLTENIENHLERQNIYVQGEAPGPEAGIPSGEGEVNLSFSETENRVSLEEHSTQEKNTELLQQLLQINQKNIENYHRYQEFLARQQEAQRNKKKSTRVQMRQESLEALKSPQELLERYREETVIREQERTERLREMTELLPEQTRKIYQALENYQADPGRWEGSQAISRNNLGLLLHDVEEAERENRRMELVMQEEQRGQKDETVTAINRWNRQARQEFRTDSREETSHQDISLVHRTAENQISQELIEQLTAQQQSTVRKENRVTERREEHNETERLDTVQTQMAARQQLFRETENLTELIEQGVRRQMNSISEQVYSKLEKRLQNEKKRRGY